MSGGPAPSSVNASRISLSSVFLVLLLGLIWGSNWPAIRVSVLEISPWMFRTVCLAGGASTLIAICLVRGTSLRVPVREIFPLIMVSLLNVTAYHMFTAYGLIQMEAGRGTILTFTFPLWSVLLGALILKEKITLARAFALALGVGALLLLIGADMQKVGRAPVGSILMVSAAIVWACGTLLMKATEWSIGSIELAAWQLTIGFVPVCVVNIFIGENTDFTVLTTPAWIGFIYCSVIAVGFGQWIWFRILETTPTAIASLSTLFVPVVGVFSSGLLLGETVGWREITALFLVCLSLFLVLIGIDGARVLWRNLR